MNHDEDAILLGKRRQTLVCEVMRKENARAGCGPARLATLGEEKRKGKDAVVAWTKRERAPIETV